MKGDVEFDSSLNASRQYLICLGRGVGDQYFVKSTTSGYPSNEVAVAHDGRQHRRGTVVACIAIEGSGVVGGVPSLEEGELGDRSILPPNKVQYPLMQRHTNFDLGHPSTVLRWS